MKTITVKAIFVCGPNFIQQKEGEEVTLLDVKEALESAVQDYIATPSIELLSVEEIK